MHLDRATGFILQLAMMMMMMIMKIIMMMTMMMTTMMPVQKMTAITTRISSGLPPAPAAAAAGARKRPRPPARRGGASLAGPLVIPYRPSCLAASTPEGPEAIQVAGGAPNRRAAPHQEWQGRRRRPASWLRAGTHLVRGRIVKLPSAALSLAQTGDHGRCNT